MSGRLAERWSVCGHFQGSGPGLKNSVSWQPGVAWRASWDWGIVASPGCNWSPLGAPVAVWEVENWLAPLLPVWTSSTSGHQEQNERKLMSVPALGCSVNPDSSVLLPWP